MQTATTFLVAAAVAAENVVSAVTVDLAKIAETVVLVTVMTVVVVIVMIVDLAKTVDLVKIVRLVQTVQLKSHSKQNLIAKSARSSVTLVPIPAVETTAVETAVIVAVDNHCQRLRSFT
jgi:hypothetical protein